MTKAQLLKKVNLDERKIKAFGGEITIRNLTVKEMINVSELEGFEAMAQMVSYAMVDPSMTKEELEAMSGKYVNDLTLIVQEVSPSDPK